MVAIGSQCLPTLTKGKVLCCKKPIKTWEVNVDNIVISKLVKMKTNSKYLIGYLDKDIKPLVLKIPKMSGYVQTFKSVNWCLSVNLLGLRLKT